MATMTAKERFEQTRRAVDRLEAVKLLIMNDGRDWMPPTNGRGGSISKPTEQQAIYNVDELADKLAALRQEEAELEDLIGTSLAIISAVAKGFGEVYATLLEARYIDCLTWTQIHGGYGIAKSTGHYLLDIAFDWIDSMGVSRLLRGEVDV